MKKVFTLLMVLLMVTGGYAQVKKQSKSDNLKKSAKELVYTGEETLNTVKNQEAMTWDFDAEDLDYSAYDWQTNTAARNLTMTFPDGCVAFAYTIATDDTYADRGTNICVYNPATGEWATTGGKIENRKAGFGCATSYGENGILVVSRDANSLACGVYIIEDKDNLPATGTLTPIIEFDTEQNLHFPAAMCTGPNHDHIHILFTALNQTINDQVNPYFYFRSMDGGATWDEYMTIDYLGREYCPQYGSGQDAYFMENHGGDRLDIIVNTRRGDGVVLTSLDEGNTWTRTKYYHHPGIDVNFGENLGYMYPRWSSALWMDETLHVAYEFGGGTGDATSTSYYPGIGGIGYWNSAMPYRGDGSSFPQGYDPTNPMPPIQGQPFIMDSAYINEDIYAGWFLWSDATHEMWPEYIGYLTPLDDNGDPLPDPEQLTSWGIEDYTLHGSYNGGVCEMPVLMQIPGSHDLVAIWIGMNEKQLDGAGKHYFRVFAKASPDGGNTWSNMINLTNDITYTYAECVYPQAAITDGKLVVACQMDSQADSYVIGNGTDDSYDDNYYGALVFDLEEIFPNVGLSTQSQHEVTSMNLWPNPAQNSLNVALSNGSTITISNMMGQVISTVKGHVGINSLDISNLSSGVYFINAGNNTQKFVVK